MPTHRTLTPELLDHLPHDDPGAARSRGDLRRINRFMGNESWILQQLPATPTRVIELGSGDGSLLTKIHHRFPHTPLNACDLAPRPADLPATIHWHQGDIFENPPSLDDATVIINLFLHHFQGEPLRRIGEWLQQANAIIVNEPHRARLPLAMSQLAHPFIHPITRHDMRVSIEAGFIEGEIPTALGFSKERFLIRESSTWRGSQRMLALRR